MGSENCGTGMGALLTAAGLGQERKIQQWEWDGTANNVLDPCKH